MSYSNNSDFTKDVLHNRNNDTFRNNPQLFPSPLLKTTVKLEQAQTAPSSRYDNGRYNKSLLNRLGPRKSYSNNNVQNSDRNDAGNSNGRNFNNNRNRNNDGNRKRSSDGNSGPNIPRKWRGNRPFYKNSQNNQHSNLAQTRLDSIRNSNQHLDHIEPKKQYPAQSSSNNLNDSQEFDATDITIQVINNSAPVPDEALPARFKMILDPQYQASIKLIQQKKRDKQVIFPFPVTPNVTALSLHDRFSML